MIAFVIGILMCVVSTVIIMAMLRVVLRWQVYAVRNGMGGSFSARLWNQPLHLLMIWVIVDFIEGSLVYWSYI